MLPDHLKNAYSPTHPIFFSASPGLLTDLPDIDAELRPQWSSLTAETPLGPFFLDPAFAAFAEALQLHKFTVIGAANNM